MQRHGPFSPAPVSPLSLCVLYGVVPVCLVDGEGGRRRLWYKHDSVFKQPKTFYQLQLLTPVTTHRTHTYTQTEHTQTTHTPSSHSIAIVMRPLSIPHTCSPLLWYSFGSLCVVVCCGVVRRWMVVCLWRWQRTCVFGSSRSCSTSMPIKPPSQVQALRHKYHLLIWKI